MDLQQRSLRIGAIVVAGAMFLRLLGGGMLSSAAQFLTSPQAAAILLYLETGRLVRLPENQNTLQNLPSTEPIPPDDLIPAPPADVFAPVVFTPEDGALVSVNSLCDYEVDVESLLMSPLTWELTGEKPTVLILHTHATESYENTEGYREDSAYRTLDQRYNMLSIGNRLAQLLEEKGIGVIHDQTLHDHPSYSGSYTDARSSIEKYLQQYPSIQIVLDLHRDAVADGNGKQMYFTTSKGGQKTAQLMMVMGTDAAGLMHPDWRDNLSLAVKLYAQLEKLCSGICRPICLRSQRFNQDLSPGALLIEVGAAGNTRQEALRGAEFLAEAIVALSHGTVS